jgi:hypothetical protein
MTAILDINTKYYLLRIPSGVVGLRLDHELRANVLAITSCSSTNATSYTRGPAVWMLVSKYGYNQLTNLASTPTVLQELIS